VTPLTLRGAGVVEEATEAGARIHEGVGSAPPRGSPLPSHRPARVAVWLLALVAGSAGAVEVSYSVLNLADTQPGHDRWLYEYQLGAFPFDAGYGFTVYFDPDLYTALQSALPAPGSDWDAILRQPDVDLGSDGFYDAEALFADPSADAVFRVSFEWLGTGTPGEQAFAVREPDPSFAVVQSGTTGVPEPTALVQHASAVLSLAALASNRRPRC